MDKKNGFQKKSNNHLYKVQKKNEKFVKNLTAQSDFVCIFF